MSALVTDPSTHATWSPSLNGPALAREMSWGFVDKLERIIDQLDREGDRAWVISAWAASPQGQVAAMMMQAAHEREQNEGQEASDAAG